MQFQTEMLFYQENYGEMKRRRVHLATFYLEILLKICKLFRYLEKHKSNQIVHSG
jgi:hypothetical protein